MPVTRAMAKSPTQEEKCTMQLEYVGGRDQGEGREQIEERIYENIIVGASQHIKKS